MNLDLIVDLITLAIVFAWFLRSRKSTQVTAPAPRLPRILAEERAHAEMLANPTRTQNIAQYLREHPECKSFRTAAAIVDGKAEK